MTVKPTIESIQYIAPMYGAALGSVGAEGRVVVKFPSLAKAAQFIQANPEEWVCKFASEPVTITSISDMLTTPVELAVQIADAAGSIVAGPSANPKGIVAGDVVTYLIGDRQYEVIQMHDESSRNNLTGEVDEVIFALIAPLQFDAQINNEPRWVNVKYLNKPATTKRSMTREEMTDWMALRGVPRDSDDMEAFLDQYDGKTEDEMDEIYDRLHG